MKYYYNQWLNVDVLLLVGVFETFTKESTSSFELDPAHYLYSNAYSCDEMLWFSDADLKLISDIEKYQFTKSIIRGDIFMIFLGLF